MRQSCNSWRRKGRAQLNHITEEEQQEQQRAEYDGLSVHVLHMEQPLFWATSIQNMKKKCKDGDFNDCIIIITLDNNNINNLFTFF